MAAWSSFSDIGAAVKSWFCSIPSRGVCLHGVLAGGAVLLVGVWVLSRRKKLPPGPRGIPWIGIGSQLTSEPLHIQCMCMRKEYNSDIISFTSNGQLNVVLHGYQLIKEAFSTRGLDFAERVYHPLHRAGFVDEVFCQGPSQDDKWATNKKFAISALRAYGSGNNSLDDRLRSEYNKLLEFLTDTNGTPTNIELQVQHAIARVTTNVTYGSSYSPDDPEVDHLLEMNRDIFIWNFSDEIFRACALPNWLLNIINPRPMQIAKDVNNKMKAFMLEKVKEHRASLDRENPRDIVDTYLISRDGTEMDEDLLAYTLIVFIADGIETLSNIAMCGILHIANNPQVQDKLQQELDKVVGKSGRPRLNNRPDLKYLQAVVLESLRASHLLPLGVEHAPRSDTKLAGYDIPSGCAVFANLYSVHMDPDIFPNPEDFSPEHFLNSAGEVINGAYCIPFSIGRRMCIGDQMTKIQLTMIFASVFHEFRLSFPPGHDQQTTLESLASTVLKPPSFKVCAVPR